MLDVHYRVLYISKKVECKWPQVWWDARKFTKAVKDGTVNGYFYVPSKPLWKLKINEHNVSAARRLFGKWLLSDLAKNAPRKDIALVPIPASNAVVGGAGPYRHTLSLTQSLTGLDHKHDVHDILRFTEVLKKASHGGPRSEGEIYAKLAVQAKIPDRPVVLIDDVLTAGGHMRACKRKLEEEGCEVLFGVVCGRTVNDEGDLAKDPWREGTVALFEGGDEFEDIDWDIDF